MAANSKEAESQPKDQRKCMYMRGREEHSLRHSEAYMRGREVRSGRKICDYYTHSVRMYTHGMRDFTAENRYIVRVLSSERETLPNIRE